MSRKWLRYRDLAERGVVRNRAQLKNLIDKYGFPSGKWLAPNTRAWAEEEVEASEDSRPTAGPEPRGAAAARHGRSRKVRENTEAAVERLAPANTS
jgi:hypothetical protein